MASLLDVLEQLVARFKRSITDATHQACVLLRCTLLALALALLALPNAFVI